jgi:hypothetical protein
MASWLEEMKKKVWNDYLLDETLSFPHLLTVTYFDTEGIERVDSSGYLYNNKGPDLTVPEYFAHKGRTFERVSQQEGHLRHQTHLRTVDELEGLLERLWLLEVVWSRSPRSRRPPRNCQVSLYQVIPNLR